MSKSKKGQKMNLGEFLAAQEGSNSSWADMEATLPTAPAASYETPTTFSTTTSYEKTDSRTAIDAPFNPPFTAYIGNLSFDITDRDLEMLLGDTKLKSIRIVTDNMTLKPKGFAYAEFDDREGLLAALALNGESVLNRRVKINVAEPQKARAEFVPSGNWRQGPADGASRPFKEQYSRNRDQFSNREEKSTFGSAVWGRKEGGNPFGNRNETQRPDFRQPPRKNSFSGNDSQKDTEVKDAPPPKPKVNPFGQATPRDEAAIQKAIEVKRLAREAESKKQAEENKQKVEDRKIREPKLRKNESNVPLEKGSWRKAQEQRKPRADFFKPKTEKNAERALSPKRKAEESNSNLFELLDEVLNFNSGKPS